MFGIIGYVTESKVENHFSFYECNKILSDILDYIELFKDFQTTGKYDILSHAAGLKSKY